MSAHAEVDVPASNEVVIVRRRVGHDEDGHHGGAWKIAFADFMTAMMAFFLVMWLVNSSDDKTLTQVASYFNPLKLTDRGTGRKGVHNLKGKEQDESPSEQGAGSPGEEEQKPDEKHAKKKEKKKEKKTDAGRKAPEAQTANAAKQKISETELFSDPYGALEKIALEARERDLPVKLGPGRLGHARSTGGDMMSDPFDLVAGRGPTSQPDVTREESQGLAPKSNSAAVTAPPVASQPPPASEAAQQQPDQARTKADPLAAEKDTIAKALAQELEGVAAGTKPRVEVAIEERGILISLTDDLNFGMFNVGSAMPNPDLVNVMARIAEVIKAEPGTIILRGHTDSRRYKSGKFDNWQLSSARAQMLSYMLIRSGIPETRIERIEGYSDRKLRMPSDPNAGPNRRIEILLRR